MARRNKKKKRMNAHVFPVPFAGVAVLVCVLGLSYIWLVGQCEAVGKELKALEKEYVVLQKKYVNEEFRWARMKSPRNMERALAARGIDMDWPTSGQIVWLRQADIFKDRVAGTSGMNQRYPGIIMNE
ncbi:MAG: hypothetical protein KAH23_03390 [Kiritimatiellae bacterium]|nr:hypothetical protein [Kiritimatiellia bacterium]